MNRYPSKTRLVRIALVSALATTALTGCSTKAPRADLAASKAQTQLEKGHVDKAIESAEQAVAADPRNPAYRAVLASAYMEAGRFQSAATTYDDAMKLGDHSPRTALSLALAKIASGDMTGAQAILYDWKDELDASDLGLATSLAGAPQRGVQILSDALRSGENTPKVRQNLAYSYALMGDWRSARLMASEDLPAAQVGDRLSEWASRAAPEQHQERVAAMLGAPMRSDSGQPQRLALSNSPTAEQLASEASALAPMADAEQATANVGRPEYNAELAPVGGYQDSVSEVVRVANAPQPRAVPSGAGTASGAPVGGPGVDMAGYQAPVVRPKNFEQAFAAPPPRGGTVGQIAAQTIEFVSRPVVQKLPARYGATSAEKAGPTTRSARRVASSAPKAKASNGGARRSASAQPSQSSAGNSGSGERLVQLGSFASEQGARRAWGIFAARWPSLSNYEMVITKARVNGRLFHRVSAAGFEATSARSMCDKVKSQGYGCFAWAEGSPLPGALHKTTRMALR